MVLTINLMLLAFYYSELKPDTLYRTQSLPLALAMTKSLARVKPGDTVQCCLIELSILTEISSFVLSSVVGTGPMLAFELLICDE